MKRAALVFFFALWLEPSIGAAERGLLARWTLDSRHVESGIVRAAHGSWDAAVAGAAALEERSGAEGLRGSSARVSVPPWRGRRPLPARDLTACAWVFVDGSAEWAAAVSAIADNGPAEKGWFLGLHRQRFTFALATRGADDGDGKLTYIHSAAAYRAGRWYHIAATWDGALQRLWVDGRLAAVAAEQSGPVLYPDRFELMLGRYLDQDEDHPWPGLVRDVRIFARALGSEELVRLAKRERPPSVPAPSRPGPTGPGGWPTHLGDPRRSGVASDPVSLPLVELWRHRARRPPRPAWPPPARGSYWQRLPELQARVAYDRAFPLVAADGKLWLASSSEDAVVCLDATSGAPVWERLLGGPVRFAPVLVGTVLVVACDDGLVYGLDPEGGEERWRYAASGATRLLPGNGRLMSVWPVRTGPVAFAGDVYFCAGLFPREGVWGVALDAATGSERWKKPLEGVSPQGYALASAARIYVPCGRAAPFVLRRASGELLGRLPSSGGAYALLAGDDLVSGPGDSGALTVAAAAGGEHLATFRGTRLVVTPERSYLHTGSELRSIDRERFLRATAEQSRLRSIEKSLLEATGKLADPRSAPARELRAEQVRVTAELAAAAQELAGSVLWRTPSAHGESLVFAGELLVAGGEGRVSAYDAKTGRAVWEAPVDGVAYELAAAEGRLFVSTGSGVVHAFGGARHGAVAPVASVAHTAEIPSALTDERVADLAQAAVEAAGVKRGYCLVLGVGTGGLAAEIAARSELTVVGFDTEPARVAVVRERLARQGLHGERVSILATDSSRLPMTGWVANLIVSESLLADGTLPYDPEEARRVLRPGGGVVFLRTAETAAPSVVESARVWLGHTRLPPESITVSGRDLLARRPALAGAGEWWHPYANAGGTASSGDRIVSSNLQLQWFGGPGPRAMVDRHLRTVPPLVSHGRLFIPGSEQIVAVDAYNGIELWRRRVGDFRRVGAPYDAGSLVTTGERLYVAAGGECLALEAATGKSAGRFPVPGAGKSRHWGYLAASGDALYGSAQRPAASRREQSRAEVVEHYREFRPLVVSEELFRLDARSGRASWRHLQGPIVNSAIALDGGRVFFVRGAPGSAAAAGRVTLEHLLRRGARLVALDASAGTVVWEQDFARQEFRHSLFLVAARGVVLACGSSNSGGNTRYFLEARDAASGALLWKRGHANSKPGVGGDHGEQVHHPAIVGDLVISEPVAFDLSTGEPANPGAATGVWSMPQRSGCGTISASASCVFFRDGNPSVLDLAAGGGVRPLNAVSRPGCWISVIPAGGLVVLPEASSGCVCAYPIQTSMAFRPAAR